MQSERSVARRFLTGWLMTCELNWRSEEVKVVSKQLRDSARGEMCTLRLIGCLPGTETVVLAHAPGTGTKGMGMKSIDICSCYACMNCHDIIDGRKRGEWDYRDIVRAMAETLMRFIEKGLITIKGSK